MAPLIPPGVSSLSGGSVEIPPTTCTTTRIVVFWYCDIEIDQGASYWPFIRLALARYQPVSIDGAHLSEVVLADFMPLTADRWLTVNRTSNRRTRHVTVFGRSYSDSSGHAEAESAPSISLIDNITGTVSTRTPATVSPTAVIDVWIERLDPARGEDFGWQRIEVKPPGRRTVIAEGLRRDIDADGGIRVRACPSGDARA